MFVYNTKYKHLVERDDTTNSAIVDGAPASLAGLRPGDRVISANGVNVARSSHDEVVALIGSSGGLLTLQGRIQY